MDPQTVPYNDLSEEERRYLPPQGFVRKPIDKHLQQSGIPAERLRIPIDVRRARPSNPYEEMPIPRIERPVLDARSTPLPQRVMQQQIYQEQREPTPRTQAPLMSGPPSPQRCPVSPQPIQQPPEEEQVRYQYGAEY